MTVLRGRLCEAHHGADGGTERVWRVEGSGFAGTGRVVRVDEGLDALAAVRRGLLIEFAALPGEGNVLGCQRRLADAIIAAEAGNLEVDAVELKRHRHLLRVIGDALVHTLLPTHTIRALSRHPGKPASLASQGKDFDFVFEVAAQLLRSGSIPIIADLTTLVGIGDVVGWGADGVSVLECKNRDMPARSSTSGRLARQRERGQRTEEYLTRSHITHPGGGLQAMYTFSLPEPDWEAVSGLLDRCVASDDGVATHAFSGTDTLTAIADGSDLELAMAQLPVDAGQFVLPAIAPYWQLTGNHRVRVPSNYPLSGERRSQLMEGELMLLRCVDMGQLAAEFTEPGREVRLTPRRERSGYEVVLDVTGFDSVTFSSQVVELCLWTPVAVHALRQSLIDHARKLIPETCAAEFLGAEIPIADGDSFTYRTAYRDGVQQ